jgi:uncharacterized membrane protein (UPF0127 family)
MTFLPRKTSPASPLFDSSRLDRARVTIGDTVIPVEVVSSVEAINKGLANRPALEASHGMLFLFDHNAKFKFWMRGMRFPIDIVWIGEDYKIVDISENLPVVSVFKRIISGSPRFYSPSMPARYVLEVNANFCEQQGIEVGDFVQFISIPL